jgi:hypothetical protein
MVGDGPFPPLFFRGNFSYPVRNHFDRRQRQPEGPSVYVDDLVEPERVGYFLGVSFGIYEKPGFKCHRSFFSFPPQS